jgi:hypothetical protein
MKSSVIEKIQKHAAKIRNGEHDKIGPGVPVTMSNALVAGEGVAQGDLNIIVADTVPRGYVLIENPQSQDKQLVPGNTVGAKHCLDSLAGVTLYRPSQWTEESLDGPCLVLTQERTVLHPTHGAVTIPAGMAVVCHYQREWDRELANERRARD